MIYRITYKTIYVKSNKKIKHANSFIPQCSGFREDRNYVLRQNLVQHGMVDLRLQHHSV